MLLHSAISAASARRPDQFIGGEQNPYMKRWWLIPKNGCCNIYLHQVLRSDDDRALHDHPWASVSIVLDGGYWELLPRFADTWPHNRQLTPHWRAPGSVTFRAARAPHRLVLSAAPSWSLFITGPKVREWGFWCPQEWRYWEKFAAGPNGDLIGRGCE